MQVSCYAIGSAVNLGYFIGQVSALQGLDMHGFEGSLSLQTIHAQALALHSLYTCHHLRWLDISYWAITKPEVSKATDMTAAGAAVLSSAESLLLQSSAFVLSPLASGKAVLDSSNALVLYAQEWFCMDANHTIVCMTCHQMMVLTMWSLRSWINVVLMLSC